MTGSFFIYEGLFFYQKNKKTPQFLAVLISKW